MNPQDVDLEKATPTERVRYLMARLREPVYGCPWDRRQTHETILPFTLEEAYEVADAILKGDPRHLREELGDLMFQVVFYAQMAEEADEFTWDQVMLGLEEKLVRRHPHVFPEGTLESRIAPGSVVSDEQIKCTWEKIKAKEKGELASVLDEVAVGLAPLQRSQKLQKSAAKIGFDWPSAKEVVDKLEEETHELREAIASGDVAHIADELGDMMFVLTNLARHFKLDAETLMVKANAKFERRFRYMEQWLERNGLITGSSSLEQMEEGWREAKRQGL